MTRLVSRFRVLTMAGWLLMIGATEAGAQAFVDPVIRYDSSTVTLRRPAGDPLEAYRQNPAFRYTEEPVEAVSLWDRFWQWVREKIFDPLGEATPNWMERGFFYLLAAAALAFAVLRLFRMEVAGVFTASRRSDDLRMDLAEVDLEAVDFDAAIAEAVAARAYRRAVRLLYLKTLKALAARHLIDWQRDKTNHEYIAELRRPALRGSFGDLTTLFEYIWYGDFAVDEAVYGQVQQTFERFSRQMQEEA